MAKMNASQADLENQDDGAVERAPVAAFPAKEEPWTLRLEDPNAEVRRRALEEVVALGAAAVQPVGRVLANDPSQGVRELAVSVLKSLKDPAAIPFLHKAVLSDSVKVRYLAVDAICQIGGPQAFSTLTGLVPQVDSKLHCYILATLGAPHLPDTTEYLSKALRQGVEPRIQRAAARALGKSQRPVVVPHLLTALGEAKDPTVRITIAEVLGELQDKRAIPHLCRSVINDREGAVRLMAARALQKIPGDRKERSEEVLRLLEQGNAKRSEIDATAILQVINSATEGEGGGAFTVTDYLIKKAVDGSEPMQPVFAELIVASAGRSTEVAGDRVSAFQAAHKLPDDKLERLRIEIGGDKALEPILRVLREDLKHNFQKPIAELNLLTQQQWQRTILFSQVGFFVRMIMSVVVFFAGMTLLYYASQQLLSGKLDLDHFLGPGISFASGLGTVLLVIYTGPLKEIRRSMIDLGAASAAFIAYVHQVLQVSHTFSAYYLDRKMTFAENASSCGLIEKAMRDTVAMLCQASSGLESDSEGKGKKKSREA